VLGDGSGFVEISKRSHTMKQRLKIGISACFMYPDPTRNAYAPKTLQYIEESMAHWVTRGGALPVMVPSSFSVEATPSTGIDANDYAQWLDALVLHGGADVWPSSYGEEPLNPNWSGDRQRDAYEIALVRAFVAAGKPVFGVCRGLQLINVAFGGTLYQDIPTQLAQSKPHRDSAVFDHHFHSLDVVAGTRLHALLTQTHHPKINSIHHQGIKDLAPGFVVEARCPDDGLIEAIRYTGGTYVAAVQWHPEYHSPTLGTLDDSAMLQDFLAAAAAAKKP
jgi:putative glutamine amidotransferase